MNAGTQLVDLTDKTKDVVYNIWRRDLNVEEEDNTDFSKKPVAWMSNISTAFTSFDRRRLFCVAIAWENIKKSNAAIMSVSENSTKPNYHYDFPSFMLNMDDETIRFCSDRNILTETNTYYAAIFETFRNIKKMEIKLSKDYELEDYERVRFNVGIQDSIERIIDNEAVFLKKIRKTLSPESAKYFVLVTLIV